FTNASLASALTPLAISTRNNADGTPKKIAALDFNGAQTLGDPHFQGGIHDHPMIYIYGVTDTGNQIVPTIPYDQSGIDTIHDDANGSAAVHETVAVTNESGAYGNLLNVQFL